jgi:hypothetical protein
MKVHAYASWPHYIDHLAPIWRNLPEQNQGQFVVSSTPLVEKAASLGVTAVLPRHEGKIADAVKSREPILVASYADLRKQGRRPIAFLEHGAGQTYYLPDKSIHGGYSGGKNRDNVELFLCPNSLVAERNITAYRSSKVEIVGCPKLDDLYEKKKMQTTSGGSIGFAFHWDCQVVEEAGTAFYDFQTQVETFIKYAQVCDIPIVGHGHPKAWKFLEPWWKDLGVTAVKEWENVVGKIDVLVVDNSSIIFEAASLRIPVVLLESPKWRKNVNHGLRFWEYAGIGPNIRPGDNLGDAIRRAQTSKSLNRAQEIAWNVYEIPPSEDRVSTHAAVQAVVRWVT